MAQQQLIKEIVSLSRAGSWTEAKAEWGLNRIYFALGEKPERCLCGHFPIIELCELINEENGHEATVGNCCVKKFLDLDSDKIFQATKRVKEDDERALNAESIEYGHEQGWFSDWDYKFYMDTWRKRNLSGKQEAHRVRINRKFLTRIETASRRGNAKPTPPKLRSKN
ncbi:MAG: hypothetical protein AAFN38_24860 [Cyanobacteria bacterium J06560_5]